MSQNLVANVAFHKPDQFAMPKVCLGQVVLWSPSPNGDKVPAIVTRVGKDSIGVQCHVDGLLNHYQRGGVHHVDDPWLKTHPMAEEQGCWDYTDRDKALNEFIASFGAGE